LSDPANVTVILFDTVDPVGPFIGTGALSQPTAAVIPVSGRVPS